jgi:hypothetical protein
MPPTVTTTLPVAAPDGAGTTMLDADHVVGVAAVPLNVTVLAPWAAPKFAPLIVTAVPAGPLVGERLVRIGAAVVVVTVKGNALLAIPPTVTSTTPASGATGVGTTATVQATFSVAINASTLTTSTFVLRGPASAVVAVIDALMFPLAGRDWSASALSSRCSRDRCSP